MTRRVWSIGSLAELSRPPDCDRDLRQHQPTATVSTGYTPNALNQYAAVDAVSQTHDNNGNLTGDGTWTFGYDPENRLTSASTSGVTASYQYDPFGRREQKTVNGTLTKYLLDGGSVIEEFDGSDTRTARYVYAPGVDEPIYMERGGNRYFYHFDGSGSVIALTGTNGIVSERYAYGPYGETTAGTSVGNPYRYTGRELDAETGLYYYRARYYSTSLGRFLSPDPIGYGDGMNLYAYVGNDPLNFTDPSGLLARDGATKSFSVYNNLASGLISQPQRLGESSSGTFRTALGIGVDFATGTGPNTREFFDNSAEVATIREIAQVQAARTLIEGKVKAAGNPNDLTGITVSDCCMGLGFFSSAADSGLSPLRQVVGNASTIEVIGRQERRVDFVVTNRSSMESLTFEILPSYPRSSGHWRPGSTITQTFRFSETLP